MPEIKKIYTNLTELTTPADGDQLVIVDISEPLDIDKTKRITVLNALVSKISKSLLTAVGDILYATASATPAVLPKPAVESVFTMTGAGVPSWKALAELVVTHIYRRQGSSPTNWNSYGSTTYTPSLTNVKVQIGVTRADFGSSSPQRIAITFPVAYTYIPVIFIAPQTMTNDANNPATFAAEDVTNLGFTLLVRASSVGSGHQCLMSWMAIGE